MTGGEGSRHDLRIHGGEGVAGPRAVSCRFLFHADQGRGCQVDHHAQHNGHAKPEEEAGDGAQTRPWQDTDFARMPHAIGSDPELSAVDVRVLVALLYWACDKGWCDMA